MLSHRSAACRHWPSLLARYGGWVLLVAVIVGGSIAAAADEPAFGEPRLLRDPEVEAVAQQVATAGLSPFQPASVSSRLRRTLLQYEALVADEAWDEAIDLIDRLQTESGRELTELPAEATVEALVEDAKNFARYVPVWKRTQRLLASLPPEGIEAYRARVERSARERFDRAAEQLDESGLALVVQQYSASKAAREARLALSELALERSDYAAARHWLGQLDPLAWGPFGRPAGVTLALLDPKANPTALAKAWAAEPRPTTLPAIPSSEQDESWTATVFARLALTSLREGDLARAGAEIRLLRGIAPDAVGRLAGRDQPLADALEAMLDQQAREDRDAPSRFEGYGDLAWAWQSATPFETMPQPQANPRRAAVPFGRNLFGQPVRNFGDPTTPQSLEPSPTLIPTIGGSKAYFVERGRLRRLDLANGEVTDQPLSGVTDPEPEDETPQPDPDALAVGPAVIRGGRNIIRIGPNSVIQRSQPAASSSPSVRLDNEITFADQRLYVQLTKQIGRGRSGVLLTEETLLGVDPTSSDEPSLRITLSQDVADAAAGYQFGSVPLVHGNRLYVVLTRPGMRTDVAVACFSMESYRELWRTELGAGEPITRIGGGPKPSIVVAGGTLYVATELGSVAAIDRERGAINWLVQYPRNAVASISASDQSKRSNDQGSLVVVGDRVITAPADSTTLLAWDAHSGRVLWEMPRSDDSQLVGVASDSKGTQIVLSGRQLASYDSLTGRQQFAWPESDHAGLRGVGAAAIVAGEIFWPTREAIYALSASTGAQTRLPVDLTPVGAAGANLVPTAYGLLVAGPERIRLLVSLEADRESESMEREGDISRLIEDEPGPTTARLAPPR